MKALFSHGVVTKRRPARLGLERRDISGMMAYRANTMGLRLPPMEVTESLGIPLSTFAKALRERLT